MDIDVLKPVQKLVYLEHPIVPVGKSGNSLRMCADYKVTTVNPNIVIDKYPLSSIQELFTKISNSDVYTNTIISSDY